MVVQSTDDSVPPPRHAYAEHVLRRIPLFAHELLQFAVCKGLVDRVLRCSQLHTCLRLRSGRVIGSWLVFDFLLPSCVLSAHCPTGVSMLLDFYCVWPAVMWIGE